MTAAVAEPPMRAAGPWRPEEIKELKAFFVENGYAIARQLFTPEEVGEIRETFMAQNANGPVEGLSDVHHKACEPDDPLAYYPRMMHPHRHPDKMVGPLAMRYMLDERIAAILSELMEDEPLAAQSMFYFKPPGARGQALHQDNFYLRVKPGTCYAMWLSIDDADEENGGMVVVPGSDKMDLVCPEESDRTIFFTNAHVPVPEGMRATPTDLKAGDVLLFNGSVIHGSYPNRSQDRFRRSFICHYLPRHSVEMVNWYSSLRFNGEKVEIPQATGGGPCGIPHETIKSPH